jgi:predicted Zn-dependent protease
MASLFQDRAKAEQWLTRAIENAPKDVRTQLAAGEYRLRNNVLDEAQKHAAEAIKLDPTNVDANLLAGVVARMNNDFPAAAKYLGEAHLMAPANGDVINHLALCLVELPDEASRIRALQFADLNARQHPDNITYMTTLGWISYQLNRKKDAERVLNAAFRATAAANNNKMNADMAYYLASLAKDTGKLEYAAKLLREAANSSEAFAYRKSAQRMLAEIEKSAAAPGGARGADTARSKAGRGTAEAPDKPDAADNAPAAK